MSEDQNQDNLWPIPKFYFVVDFGGEMHNCSFQEVSGLDGESEILEYRSENSPEFSTVKMPGMVKSGNVTLKKGVFVKDNSFFDWYSQVKMNTIKRIPVTIKLLDEQGSPTMVWTLKNAWPTKITGTDLKSDGNEVAVETIEIAHEGLTIVNG